MSWRYDAANAMDATNAYINENEFICNLVMYEQNEKNGKCYKHTAEGFFGRVKRKVSKQEFEERKATCLKSILAYEQSTK